MTVAQLVKEKKDKQEAYLKKEEAQRKRKATIKHEKDFEDCVQTVIRNFENGLFSAQDTDEKVADVLMCWSNGRTIIETNNVQYHTLKYGFGWNDTYSVNCMNSVKFSESDRSGKTLITNHKGFCEWKDYLEKKFGVEIYIFRDYTYEERDEAPDNEIFVGIRASVKLIDE